MNDIAAKSRLTQVPAPGEAGSSLQGPAEVGAVGGKPTGKRQSAKVVRIIGNLFILIGVLILLGIGGWYGYTEWSNEQYREKLVENFGADAYEPPVLPTSLPAPEVQVVVPDLTGGAKGSSGLGIQQAAQVDNSPPVRLYLPSVNIDTKVVPVGWDMIPAPNGKITAEWQVADYAVGHHKGSANPGQPGNVVLSGHVDYKGQVFRELHKSQKGDEVIVYTEKGQYLYVVTNIVLVKEVGVSEEQRRRNAAYMDPTPDPTLTMITCWPYGIDDHRLIVIAKPYQSTLSTQSEFTIR